VFESLFIVVSVMSKFSILRHMYNPAPNPEKPNPRAGIWTHAPESSCTGVNVPSETS
jgi:hypothetical protein